MSQLKLAPIHTSMYTVSHMQTIQGAAITYSEVTITQLLRLYRSQTFSAIFLSTIFNDMKFPKCLPESTTGIFSPIMTNLVHIGC